MDIPAQVAALGRKYGAGQQAQRPFGQIALNADNGHHVPVDNFLNAQCKRKSHPSQEPSELTLGPPP